MIAGYACLPGGALPSCVARVYVWCMFLKVMTRYTLFCTLGKTTTGRIFTNILSWESTFIAGVKVFKPMSISLDI